MHVNCVKSLREDFADLSCSQNALSSLAKSTLAALNLTPIEVWAGIFFTQWCDIAMRKTVLTMEVREGFLQRIKQTIQAPVLLARIAIVALV